MTAPWLSEAAREKYPPSKLIEDYDGDRYVDDEWGYDECQRAAFIAGAELMAEKAAEVAEQIARGTAHPETEYGKGYEAGALNARTAIRCLVSDGAE